jgi:hypothetical protein
MPAHIVAVMLEALETDVVMDGEGGDMDEDPSSPTTAQLSPSGATSCSNRVVKSGMTLHAVQMFARGTLKYLMYSVFLVSDSVPNQ